MRQHTQAFTSTEVHRLMMEARDRDRVPHLWARFCEHAINEENAHARRDAIAPTVNPLVVNREEDSDDSDESDGDYDSEAEEEAAQSSTFQIAYSEEVN